MSVLSPADAGRSGAGAPAEDRLEVLTLMNDDSF